MTGLLFSCSGNFNVWPNNYANGSNILGVIRDDCHAWRKPFGGVALGTVFTVSAVSVTLPLITDKWTVAALKQSPLAGIPQPLYAGHETNPTFGNCQECPSYVFLFFVFCFLFFLCRLGSELLDWSMLRSEMQFTNLSYSNLDSEATSLNHFTHCHFAWMLGIESFRLKHANMLTIMCCYVLQVCIVCGEGDCSAYDSLAPSCIQCCLLKNAMDRLISLFPQTLFAYNETQFIDGRYEQFSIKHACTWVLFLANNWRKSNVLLWLQWSTTCSDMKVLTRRRLKISSGIV